MSQPSGFSGIAQGLRELGPWAPMLALLILFLGAGIDISLGHAQDDPRLGYLFLALFALTAGGAIRWRQRPRAMATLCVALIALQLGLGILGWASSLVPLNGPFFAILGVIVGALGLAAALFVRRAALDVGPHSG